MLKQLQNHFLKKFKISSIFQPIRIALTGGTQAPSVYDIISILGFMRFLKVKKALKEIFKNLDYLKK